MSKTFFRSDDHFRHPKVAATRGFGSVDEHDEHLIAAHNEIVGVDDTTWFLGDLNLAVRDLEDVLDMVDQMNGHKRLVLGNHDAGSHMSTSGHKHLDRYKRSFESVAAMATIKIAGHRVILTHLPYSGDHTEEDRYVGYRPQDGGGIYLHGHVHSDERFRGRQIHVGLDAWDLKPVPLAEIEAYIRSLG